MLLHRTDPNDLLCKDHVENPHRLSSILNHLKYRKTLDDCEIVDNMDEIDWKYVI